MFRARLTATSLTHKLIVTQADTCTVELRLNQTCLAGCMSWFLLELLYSAIEQVLQI